MLTQSASPMYAGLRAAVVAEAVAVLELGHFARVAETEGYPDAAKLLYELSESVGCAARGHLEAIEALAEDSDAPLSSTRLNLAAAVEHGLESLTLYPELVDGAHEEGLYDTASWLTAVAALKQDHLDKLGRALEALSSTPRQWGAAADAPEGSATWTS